MRVQKSSSRYEHIHSKQLKSVTNISRFQSIWHHFVVSIEIPVIKCMFLSRKFQQSVSTTRTHKKITVLSLEDVGPFTNLHCMKLRSRNETEMWYFNVFFTLILEFSQRTSHLATVFL